MQHFIFCEKCNNHTTVEDLKWTTIACNRCGEAISIQNHIDVLVEKIESRDLNVAHLDKLVDRLEEEIEELDSSLHNRQCLIDELEKRNWAHIKKIDELESHNRVLTGILEKVAETIPEDELSRRMYGFICDDEGNIREVSS